ncbi:MAG: DUF4407 domain-containing protein [Bacteroidetes bacterium]|nr:MAG: DUF4407 domain-containing protein [Bacteroidota bacterium]
MFGAVWGAMIFNLDRYIVSSMKSHGQWWRDFLVAVPRLVLAVFLAVVISKPLELKIFEKEIEGEIVQMEQEVWKAQEDRVRLRFEPEIAANLAQIAQLKSEIAAQTAARDTLARLALQEADGTGGSRKRNLGPIYRAKKREADLAQAELDSLRAFALPLIQNLENQNRQLNAQIAGAIQSLERTNYDGLAARMEALDRLGAQSRAIYWANIFIMLLFIAIETAPVVTKLIAYRSPYDYVLHEHEHRFRMSHLENTTRLAQATKNKIRYDSEVGTYLNNARIEAEKKLIDETIRADQRASFNRI